MDKRVIRIQDKISKLVAELKGIQDACTHPHATLRYQYDSNTGNWCKADDSYWTNLYCGLCDKRWTEDGSLYLRDAIQVPTGSRL